MKKDNTIYLEHILRSIRKIEEYTHDLSFEQFVEHEEKQDAVTRNFEIIGEASKKVSPELKLQYPDIPWKAVAGMRDKLIHDYFDVDYETIWETVQTHIPFLKTHIEAILSELRNK